MQLEQLEARNVLSGLSIIGTGLTTNAIDVVKPQTDFQALVPGQGENVAFVDPFGVTNAVVGSDADDVFTIEEPTAGGSYSIHGAGGYDVLALKEFVSSDVTITDGQLQVAIAGGSFVVDFSDVERISFADMDHITSAASVLGRAGEFDVFVAEDMLASSTDVEGRIAIGGSADFANMGFGTRLTNPTEPSLYVGGDLKFIDGSVEGGAVITGNLGVTEELFRRDTFTVAPSPINFEVAHNHLIDASRSLAEVSATHTNDITSWNAITMDASGQSGLSVFELTGEQLVNAVSWDIRADAGATVLVNISGDDLHVTNFQMSLNGQALHSGIAAPFNVVLNFPDATQLSSAAFSWQGILLAPLADMQFDNGHINGQMYVKSVSGGGEYHLTPMDPALPNVTASTQTVVAIVDTSDPGPIADPVPDAPHGLEEKLDGFDLFVVNDFVGEVTGVDGSVAVGGDAQFLHVGIGQGAENWINEDALVVGNDVTFEGGHGRSYGPVAVGGIASGVTETEVRTDTPIDFSNIASELTQLSDSLGALTPTANAHITPWHSIHIDATDTPGEISVVELSGADLGQATKLEIDGDVDSTIVVNVTGDDLSIAHFGMFLNGEYLEEGDSAPFELLFNFVDATQVQTNHIAWSGSVLAPRATWNLDNARMLGQLAVSSLNTVNGGFYADVVGGDQDTGGGVPDGGTDGGGTAGDPPNTDPVAVNDDFQTCNHEVITGDVSLNDSDADGHALVYVVSSQPQNGIVKVDLDGNFKYEANLGFVGTDSFEYVVSDGHDGSATGIVTIEVVDCTPPEVDVSVEKSSTNVTAGVRWSRSGHSDQIAYPYDVFEYSVTITNHSDYKASGIVVEDVIPENVDVWKPGDSLVRSDAGKRWDNNYWKGQVHTLEGFDGSPEIIDPTNGNVTVVEAGTASKGQTISPGETYDLETGSVTWELGVPLEAGESVTLKYYGMREVYSAYNWSYGTQFVTDASVVSLDQVDSDLTNNQDGARSWWVSPIALDLNGDGGIGVTGDSTARGHAYNGGDLVQFDIDADGKLDTIEWFAGDGDGILVDTQRIAADGQIDGSALFGDLGGRYEHGYEMLSLRDGDGDGSVRGDELVGLALWLDDGDALLEDGELSSLGDHDIEALSVLMTIDAAGRMRSEALLAGGGSLLSEDVWFALG